MIIFAKQLIGLRAETKSGQYLGRIKDFEIDADALEIKKIYVRPASIVKGLVAGDLIVAKNMIVSIDKDKIVVDDLMGAGFVKSAERKQRLVVENSPISASTRE